MLADRPSIFTSGIPNAILLVRSNLVTLVLNLFRKISAEVPITSSLYLNFIFSNNTLSISKVRAEVESAVGVLSFSVAKAATM